MAEVSPQITPLPAMLYLVSTPIGSARDITLRALDILASADVLAAEDTRVLRKLMSIYGIAVGDRPLIPYHDHNAHTAGQKLLAHIQAGRSVALCSDAGTPLIADPGFDIVRQAREQDVAVTAAPGPVAAIVALSLSGLPTDRFSFAGFPPPKSAARKSFIEEFKSASSVTVLYESPNRIKALVADLIKTVGGDRVACVARELTKKFEQVVTRPLDEIAEELEVTIPLKGEFVVILDKAAKREVQDDEVKVFISEMLAEHSVKEVATEAAATFGIPRKVAYSMALAHRKT